MANNSNLKPFSKGFDVRRGQKPKGSKHISTLIQEMTSDPSFSTYIQDPAKGYVEYKGAPLKAIVGTVINRAIAGDLRAAEWIARHGWGKPIPEPAQELPKPILTILHQYPKREELPSEITKD